MGDDGVRRPATDDGRWGHRLSPLLPRLLLLAVFAVVVGLLVDDPVLGIALVVLAQALTLLPEIVRNRRKR